MHKVPLDSVHRPYNAENVALAEEQRKLKRLLKKESWNSDERNAVRQILDGAAVTKNPYVTSKLSQKAEGRLAQYSQPGQESDELRRLREQLHAAQGELANQSDNGNRIQGSRGGCQDVACTPNSNEWVEAQEIARLKAQIRTLEEQLRQGDDNEGSNDEDSLNAYKEACASLFEAQLKNSQQDQQQDEESMRKRGAEKTEQMNEVIRTALALSQRDILREYSLHSTFYSSSESDLKSMEVEKSIEQLRFLWLANILDYVRNFDAEKPITTRGENNDGAYKKLMDLLGGKKEELSVDDWNKVQGLSEGLIDKLAEFLRMDPKKRQTEAAKKARAAKKLAEENRKEGNENEARRQKLQKTKLLNKIAYDFESVMWQKVGELTEDDVSGMDDSTGSTLKTWKRRLNGPYMRKEMMLLGIDQSGLNSIEGGTWKAMQSPKEDNLVRSIRTTPCHMDGSRVGSSRRFAPPSRYTDTCNGIHT